MNGDEGGRSPELDQVRQMLFGDLPVEEGWALVDAAVSGARDADRWERIEREAAETMNDDLLALVKRMRHRRGLG